MKAILFYTFYLVTPIPLVYAFYSANPGKYMKANMLSAMILGVLAFTWFVWQFILSARPKVIEHFLPLDRIYRLHGIMAIMAISLGLGHKVILERYFGHNLMTWFGGAGLIVFGFVTIVSLFIVTKKGWIPWIRGDRFQRLINKYRYEHNKAVHNLSFIGLLFVTVHMLMTSSARAYTRVYVTIMAYSLIGILFYTYHKLLKPWFMKEYPYEVVDVVKEGDSVTTVHLKPRYRKCHYQPGQYAFFSMLVNGHRETHPFSFASAPDSLGHISITVKKLGDFTSGLHDLAIGSGVMIEGPFGAMTHVNYKKEKKLFLICGGVGITPMISMLRYMKENEQDRSVVLLWGVRKEEDLIFMTELDHMKRSMNKLTVVPVISADKDYYGEKGYVQKEIINRYMVREGFDIQETGFYICGPGIMMKNCVRGLKEMGVGYDRIHHESFSL